MASTSANVQIDDNGTNVSAPLAIVAIVISGVSLLWNIITLIIAIIRKRNSGGSV